jgi:hypothetical protein
MAKVLGVITGLSWTTTHALLGNSEVFLMRVLGGYQPVTVTRVNSAQTPSPRFSKLPPVVTKLLKPQTPYRYKVFRLIFSAGLAKDLDTTISYGVLKQGQPGGIVFAHPQDVGENQIKLYLIKQGAIRSVDDNNYWKLPFYFNQATTFNALS